MTIKLLSDVDFSIDDIELNIITKETNAFITILNKSIKSERG